MKKDAGEDPKELFRFFPSGSVDNFSGFCSGLFALFNNNLAVNQYIIDSGWRSKRIIGC